MQLKCDTLAPGVCVVHHWKLSLAYGAVALLVLLQLVAKQIRGFG
jgi:hypothetical protein